MTELKELHKNLLESNSCKKYFCTTCGGIAASVSELLANEDVISQIFDIEKVAIEPKDFNKPREQGFPKEPQCSNYILFLRDLILKLQTKQQEKLVDCWVKDIHLLEDLVIDGIGYYLIPEGQKQKWLPTLTARTEFNDSIEETIKLKYRS